MADVSVCLFCSLCWCMLSINDRQESDTHFYLFLCFSWAFMCKCTYDRQGQTLYWSIRVAFDVPFSLMSIIHIIMAIIVVGVLLYDKRWAMVQFSVWMDVSVNVCWQNVSRGPETYMKISESNHWMYIYNLIQDGCSNFANQRNGDKSENFRMLS